MEFKGTKNEWYIGEHRQNGIQIGCSQSHYVACAYRGGADRNDDETIANAQLISAAPELLKALQSLANGVRERGYAGRLSDYLRQADTIIAKALGKEADDE